MAELKVGNPVWVRINKLWWPSIIYQITLNKVHVNFTEGTSTTVNRSNRYVQPFHCQDKDNFVHDGLIKTLKDPSLNAKFKSQLFAAKMEMVKIESCKPITEESKQQSQYLNRLAPVDTGGKSDQQYFMESFNCRDIPHVSTPISQKSTHVKSEEKNNMDSFHNVPIPDINTPNHFRNIIGTIVPFKSCIKQEIESDLDNSYDIAGFDIKTPVKHATDASLAPSSIKKEGNRTYLLHTPYINQRKSI